MDSLKDMWQLACEKLKESCGEVIYDIWIKPLEIIRFDGARVEIAASEFVKKIIYDIEAFEGVLGIHDVICHMYGPTTCFMSVHVEVDCRSDINVSHDLIDNIEKEVNSL